MQVLADPSKQGFWLDSSKVGVEAIALNFCESEV